MVDQVVVEAPERLGAQEPPESGAWARWRPLLLRLHFYGGLLAGPFILVAALTGLLYTCTPQLDGIVFQHEVTVNATAPHRTSLAAQIAAARTVYPEAPITSVKPPTVASETTQIAFAAPGVPQDYTRTVFVNPYTAQVQGTLTTYGQWLPIRSWFDTMHRTLHLGVVGRCYSEIAASWLWVIALGGLALWIGGARGRGARGLVVPDRAATGRARTRSWHGAVGGWIVLGLLALSVTGLTWSRFAGEHVSELRSQLSWTTPSVSTALPGDPSAEVAPGSSAPDPTAGADAVLAGAEQLGLKGPMWMTPPAKPGQAWQVAENKRDFPTRQDAAAIAPDGHVVDVVRFASWPITAKLTRWAVDTHMGILFGLPNQIALAALAVCLLTVIARGYVMWWRRRPTRGGFAPGPRRGALAGLRPIEAVVAVAVLVGVGWFAPLFGTTLGLFVLGDALVGEYRRRRAGIPVGTGGCA
ncbi:PepSY-associated TM helix domain-containing protein [Tsukamurella soli]|uniref:PepSY-associated TM helix domain-containing protein n=1 Tax=Tsukamurella soli TaxID=644556 RepID=UPI00360B41DF